MLLRKSLSFLGILIPILFLIFFGLLFDTNPVTYESIDEVSWFFFNIKELDSHIWIRVLNYFIIGFLIILFSLGMIKLNSKSFSNNLGFAFLAFSGFIWSSFAFFTVSAEDIENDIDISFLLIYLFLFSSFLAFLLIYGEIRSIVNRKVVQKSLLVASVLIFTETLLGLIIDNYPIMVPNLSMLFYMAVFPIIGYNLSKDL